MKALVVFRDCERPHPLSFLLKSGFHHCFVCIEKNDLWIQIDYGRGVPIITYLSDSDFDLAGYYLDQGMVVVETTQGTHTSTIPFVLRNCVGMVKQILCIRNFAFTPFGIYKRLRRK